MTGGSTSDLGRWEPLPLEEAVGLFTGAPFRWWISGGVALEPEIQLLFKAKGLRPKDDLDAREVVPSLEAHRRDRLRTWLEGEHSWQQLLVSER